MSLTNPEPFSAASTQAEPQPFVETIGLAKHYALSTGLFSPPKLVRAVDHVSIQIWPGETLGLVGESGCGKSTFGRALLRLVEPTAGRILIGGKDITRMTQRQLRPIRQRLQVIFQDPYASLDPRMNVEQLISEPLEINRVGTGRPERRDRVRKLLSQVGLPNDVLGRYPHEFSGGQRQRIGIARALALGPEFIVCDEPLSALDVSIQAQIVNLLLDLRDTLNMGYLFISHDLNVVRFVSHRIAVMYLGRIVELGPAEAVATQPKHPYTQLLLSSIPIADPERPRLAVTGTPDAAGAQPAPAGCAFRNRCPRAIAGQCDEQVPELSPAAAQHQVACWNPNH